MREHMGLYRGKRSNGEWAEGSLHIEYGEMTKDGNRAIDYRILGMRGECYYVDPDTVGECTGLKDKNGKWIFEGDIVHCVARLDEANCVVIYEQGEFRLVPERYYKTYVTGGGYHALWCFDKEIIGNITDNPELLKGGEGA